MITNLGMSNGPTSQPFRECLQLGKFVVKLYYEVAFSICAIVRLLSVSLDYII
jgi:hypothetical protein